MNEDKEMKEISIELYLDLVAKISSGILANPASGVLSTDPYSQGNVIRSAMQAVGESLSSQGINVAND